MKSKLYKGIDLTKIENELRWMNSSLLATNYEFNRRDDPRRMEDPWLVVMDIRSIIQNLKQ